MNPNQEKIKITISLLVSNSIDTIEKCMQSLVPLLRKIPSELIVVDTGGTDGAIEIAKKYADKVIPFVWCNDFSKARNAGLKEAKGEWFLFLDDDEWFENIEAIISFFDSGDYINYNSASYKIRNYHDKEGRSWEEIYTLRMVKREKKTQFISAIHEMLTPIKYPTKHLDCYVHHYGYVFENEEEAKKHAYRNIPLLKLELEKNPYDYRLIIQLIKEYFSIGEFGAAENISWDALGKIQETQCFTNYNVKMFGWILTNIVKIKVKKEEYAKAISYGEEFAQYDWINEVARHHLLYHIINISYRIKDYETCIKYISNYETTFNKLFHDEAYRMEKVILDQESIINNQVLSDIYTMVSYSACVLGERKQADIYFDKMIKLKSIVKTTEELVVFFQYLAEENNKIRRTRIIKHLLEDDGTTNNISIIMDSDDVEENLKNEICIMLSDMNQEDIRMVPYQIYNQHLKGNKEKTKELLEDYIRQEENVLQMITPLLSLIEEYRINVTCIIDRKELKEWIAWQTHFLENTTAKKIKLLAKIIELSPNKGFNTNMLYMCCLEKQMKASDIIEKKYLWLQNTLEKYILAVRMVYCNIYKEETFTSHFNIFLPKSCQFVEKISDIFKEDVEDIAIAKMMKEAAELYPEMADFCKVYILKMQEESKKKNIPEEFIQLSIMIKGKIREFISMGAIDAARQTLAKLETMIPGDAEIAEFKKEIETL